MPQVETAPAANKEDNAALLNQLEVLKQLPPAKLKVRRLNNKQVEKLQVEIARLRSTPVT